MTRDWIPVGPLVGIIQPSGRSVAIYFRQRLFIYQNCRASLGPWSGNARNSKLVLLSWLPVSVSGASIERVEVGVNGPVYLDRATLVRTARRAMKKKH